jgi:hypothetical protein
LVPVAIAVAPKSLKRQGLRAQKRKGEKEEVGRYPSALANSNKGKEDYSTQKLRLKRGLVQLTLSLF